MRQIAERLPQPARWVLVALAIVVAYFVLRWVDEEDDEQAGDLTAERVEIHVELRGWGYASAFNLYVMPVEPMFTHLPPTANDRRRDWFVARVPAAEVEQTLARLAREPDVEQAFVAPAVSLPTTAVRADDACPINTPSFEEHQGYLGPAPAGIDAPAAWRRGTRGQGVWFADVEGGWNAKHEDLPGSRIALVHGGQMGGAWRAHGTAVLGEVAGVDNGKGVVGIAPDIEKIVVSSISRGNVADALDAAAEALRPGDVLLIELQMTGPRGAFLPVEFFDDNFDAIRAATDRGVIVIEAAGNGAEDLDHEAYKRKFDPAYRDSGAILVGAGGPPRPGFVDRERLDFSNYGARVDVQGWGRKVATLDYGDLQACSGADRHYTNEFSGTSSASPIVAGAAVLLESDARARGTVLAPRALRDLLRDTGTSQAGDATREHIGPRPDLARAFEALR